MVRRLVIPIEIPVVAPVRLDHRSGWRMIDGDAELRVSAPGEPAAVAANPDAQGATDPFSAAVVLSKVRSPAIRPTTLERPRLLAWLDQHASARLRVITAEAGYGKSTLLADHSRRTSSRTIWYRLEPSDRDWVTLISYIVASVRELEPAFGRGTIALLQQVGVLNPTRDVTLDTLLAELETIATDPLTMILDDFHTVQDSGDVRAIVVRLLEHAPPGLSLVIAGRSRPAIPMARLAALTGVAELGTDELRFTRRETADLFASSYGTPIDDDLVDAIDGRLEGWGASLQLVCASLLALRPDEVRSFVRDLSAHSDPLYDFLVEEVLGRQTAAMRRVLMHASLLERISPPLVSAATADPKPVAARQLTVCLSRAEDAGLISRTSTGSDRWRFHPLVREFLRERLLSTLSDSQRQAMHLRVAIVAEANDWIAATHHYIEAGHPEDGMRVIRNAAMEALGTASWGQALELVERAGDQPPILVVAIIRARALVAEGQPDTAVTLLDEVDEREATALERSLVRMTRAAALFMLSRPDELIQSLLQISGDDSTPQSIRSIVDAWMSLLKSSSDEPLLPIARTLRNLARQHKSDGLAYFAGISLNNAMCVELARGAYDAAIGLGRDALQQFSQLPARAAELGSLHSTLAIALAEAGDESASWEHVEMALSAAQPQLDALGECAWLAAVTGRDAMAWSCLDQAERSLAGEFFELGADATVAYAQVILSLAKGDSVHAGTVLEAIQSPVNALCGDQVRRLMLRALIGATLGRPDAVENARAGLALARRQGAWRWEPRLRLILAAATSSRDDYPRLLADVTDSGPLALLEVADLVVDHLDLVMGDRGAIEQSIERHPTRWLPALRRSLGSGGTPRAHAAAPLVAKFGAREDLVVLSAWEQTYMRSGRQRILSTAMSRRVTPILRVHDLGRTTLSLESANVALSQVRRKASGLLLYLTSRPGQSAGREMVLEELWPEASPRDALNSLHQTMYYLRRCIDQWYDESTSADYVVLESELLYLDPVLVAIDSVNFHRDAAAAVAASEPLDVGTTALAWYRGQFAPEFEYEEWAIEYRGRTHAQYLRLVQKLAEHQMHNGANDAASSGLTAALRIDPSAFELEGHLVVALWRGGARASALEHYKHYAHVHERELGLPAAPVGELIGKVH